MIDGECIKTAKEMFFQAGCYRKRFKYLFTCISRIAVMDLQPPPVDKVYASFEELLQAVNVYPTDQGYAG